ncbi:LOW QUALITY PROTEIN: beta-ketoacyl synthase domain-containing protein [Colletotrichum navitas]|uniref:Beta-ketoacyl synthase domain-containing protein n=1 Tax=Colletotrichum navitas TaxID=681940 RepID=A0AAD8Q209_9PEZI|nr:LOW QUALITY PROTEIN: beta-ketoacyl synthase domain-containing protein [Colletotrichum navitas]KAK1594233.1 LOW QUALITY PROTEIN: beta-ketoacyl synthase domain-containing protein [Colletotrichum navitas]
MYNDTTHDMYSACNGKVHSDSYEPIAIIGMGMRLPGHVHNATDYWDLLVKGKSGRCPVPKSRYNVNNWYGPGRVSHVPTKFGYFLEELNLAHVDPSFWSFTKQEAELMDPRQRLFLEVAYEALENSGSKSWKGNDVGVYVGTMGDDWATLESRDERNLNPIRPDVFGDYILANRASYEFDLTGPSVVVRTACSASLVALHQACQDLHSADCSSALVGGVNLILTPKDTASMHQNGVLSPSGSCKSFDADADGFARGEGVSAIYIKRLSDAVRDGDPIRSVIRSTCTAGNGRTLGLTTPNPELHERLMRRGHRLAGITDLSKTAMVECHGTGTPVGDPLEVSAVANIWGENGIYIGSVKPNIGHGEGAAGLSSVIKMVLALENSTIPPNINFKAPNPRIPWESAKLKVPTEPLRWPTDRCERVSVNGFGIGGSNAHVSVDARISLAALIFYQVLLESTACFGLPSIKILNKSNTETPYHRLLAFSAKHPDSVKSLTNKVENYLNQSSGSLNNVAYSLAARREIHTYRAFCVTDGKSALQISPVIKRKCSTPEVIWVFTGQGAQWAQMGKELIEQEPLFGERIGSLDKILAGLSEPPSWTIKELLVAPEDESRLSEAEFSQPCLLAIQVALVDLLRSWGVVPSAVVGHSSGETAAAYASGAITAEEAILIAYHRGQITRLIKATHNGSMAAVGLGRNQVEQFLRPGVIVGCENSPFNVTLSGEKDVLQDVLLNIRLKNPEVLARALRVECGYHSHHMQTAAEDFTSLLEGLPCVPFYSSVTGVKNTDMSHSYWVNNVLSPVLFSTAVRSVLDDFTSPVFVEIGPHSALAGPIRQILQFESRTAQYIPTLTAGELWLAGTTIDIAVFLTDLPTYPWHYDKELSRSWRFRKFPHHELLGSRVEEISDALPSWRCNMRLEDVSWLRDHVTIFPASGFISMIGEALRQLTGSGEFTLSHVSFEAALVLDDRPVELVTTWYDFSISSLGEANGHWVKHVSGQCRAGSGKKRLPPQMSSLPRQRFGLNYGSSFRGISGITSHVTEPRAVATLDDRHSGYNSAVYSVHPATIDTSMHVAMVASCKGLERNFRQLAEMFVGKSTGPIQSLHEAVPVSKVVGVSEGQVVIDISGLQNSHSNEEDPHAGAVLEWKPDIDFRQTDVDSHVLDRMVLACIVDLRAQIQFLPATQPHLVKEAMTGQYPGVINPLEIATMSHKVRHAFIVKMLEGTVLFDIALAVYRVHIYGAGCFSGSSHAVKTLAQPEHLTGFLRFIDDVDFSSLLQLLGHKNPNMSILHIDPAAETTDISSAFSSPDGERTYGTYTYTGVSIKPAKFIETRFESSSAVKYRQLAIEEDPIPQGFAEESFDLIISQRTIAPFSSASIINMRRLLKPRGYLILQRPNPASKVLQLAFGLVPEINLGGESPSQPDALREQLRLAGFDDVSSAIFTGEHGRITVARPCQYFSKPVRAIVICQDSNHPVVSSAIMFLQSRGISLQHFPPGHRLPRGQPILCLLDLESPFLHNMGPAQWDELKKSLFSAQDEKMLWVTGASQMQCKDPNYSLTLGAARSVRRELAMDLATLELEFFNVHGWDAMATVLESFGGRFRGGEVDSDSEYVFSNGSIQICRFHSIKVMDNLREQCDNAPKTLNIVNPGSLQALRWEETEGVGLVLDGDNLRVEDLHTSLSDVSSEAGISSKFGLEGSGIVTGVGPDARQFRVGDRVAFNHDSALSTSIILSESLCAEIPAAMGFEEAASTPYSFGIVLHGLMELGKLKKGQSVLIHSASDALGAAAINVARLIGAQTEPFLKIVCTVRTSEQAEYLMSSYEIPKTCIFNCGDTSFSHGVLQLTAGVDVVFNTLPEFLQESWDCLSPLGTLVHVVQHRAHNASHLRMDRSNCNRTFASVDFEDLRINRPRECTRLLEQAFTLNKFGLNNTAPEVLTFEASDVVLAFQHLQSDKHVGRVVVRMPRSSGELQALPLRSQISLRHDRTYIIVGGAGGLGQATGRFLVERGARDLIFFSRSAEEASKIQPQYFTELEYLGCRVQAISGSVDRMADVVRMMDSVSSPIAGVLNAAMVLQDTNLADMTFEQWQATVSPKVQGTWNLHYALQAQSEPLDFFFLFSSLSGLGGQIGQANYAAGNAFLDAFVQYRHSQSLPCSVLDIGIMEDIGVLARETTRLEALRTVSQHCLHEQDLLDAVELMIQRSNGRLGIGFEQGEGLARGYINPSQLAIGMRSSASANRTGWQRDPRTLFLTSAASTHGQVVHSEHETGSSLREFLHSCASDPGKLSSDEAKEFLAKEIGGALRGFMMRQDAEVNLSLPLQTDSLVTVELRNWFRQKLGVVFTVVELRRAESILALGGLTAAKLSAANM